MRKLTPEKTRGKLSRTKIKNFERIWQFWLKSITIHLYITSWQIDEKLSWICQHQIFTSYEIKLWENALNRAHKWISNADARIEISADFYILKLYEYTTWIQLTNSVCFRYVNLQPLQVLQINFIFFFVKSKAKLFLRIN